MGAGCAKKDAVDVQDTTKTADVNQLTNNKECVNDKDISEEKPNHKDINCKKMGTIEEYDTIQGFMDAVNKRIESKERFIVYITGKPNVDGVSWCAYCDKFKPFI